MANTTRRGARDSASSIHGNSTPPSTMQRPGFPRTTSDSGVLSEYIMERISACDLLNKDPEYNGFLYKRSKQKVTDRLAGSIHALGNLKWQLRYVVLYQHHIIYFKSEKSSSPQGSFSLRGYNRVLRSVEMESADQQWAFKLIGLRADDRTWYFAAASEREMKLWMAHFKVAMEECLHGHAKERSLRILTDLKAKNKALETSPSAIPELDDRQSVISNDSNGSNYEPGVYEDIESEVYDGVMDEFENDPRGQFERPLPQTPGLSSSAPAQRSNQWDDDTISEPIRVGQDCKKSSLQRPMLPTRSPMPRRDSIVSNDSEDYIEPNEQPKEEMINRPIRREPDGNSFRGYHEERNISSQQSNDIYDEAGNSSDEEDKHDYEPPPEDPTKKVKPTPPPANTKPKKPEPPPASSKPSPENNNNKPHKHRKMPVPPPTGNRLAQAPKTLPRPPVVKPFTTSTLPPKPANKPTPPAKPTSNATPSAPKSALKPPLSFPTVLPPSLPVKTNNPEEDQTDAESKPPPIKPKPPGQQSKPSLHKIRKSLDQHQDVEELLPHTAVINSSDKVYCEGLLQTYQHEGMYLLRMAGDKQGKVLMVWYAQENKSKHYKIFGDNQTRFNLDTSTNFSTMIDLLTHYHENELPSSNNLTLSTPYMG